MLQSEYFAYLLSSILWNAIFSTQGFLVLLAAVWHTGPQNTVPVFPPCQPSCPAPVVLGCCLVPGSVWVLGWALCQSRAWSPVGRCVRGPKFLSRLFLRLNNCIQYPTFMCELVSTCRVWGNQVGCWARFQLPVGWRSLCWRSVWLSSPAGPRWQCWCSFVGLARRFYLEMKARMSGKMRRWRRANRCDSEKQTERKKRNTSRYIYI